MDTAVTMIDPEGALDLSNIRFQLMYLIPPHSPLFIQSFTLIQRQGKKKLTVNCHATAGSKTQSPST